MPRATNVSVRQDTHSLSTGTLGQYFKNPFVPDMMEATLPSNWKNLTIKKYDGTSDPDKDLDVYVTN